MARREGGSRARPFTARSLAVLLLGTALAAVRADEPKDLPPPRIRKIERVPSGVPAPAPAPAGATPGAVPRAVPETPTGLPAPFPSEPPPRPTEPTKPRPGDFVFEVERPGGLLQRFQESPDVAVLVLAGNPKLSASSWRRPDGSEVGELSLKAGTLVLWIDVTRVPQLDAFESLRLGGEGDEPAASKRPATPKRSTASILQDALLGVYAEDAVELRFGDLAFRTQTLYIDPRNFKGLLVEPRFDGHVQGKDVPVDLGARLPIHVRARRGRLLAQGLTVFDDAEVTTSRADDRLSLHMKQVTIEEYAKAVEGPAALQEPHLLGYRNLSSQRFRAQNINVRGERLPLFYLPSVEFGHSEGEAFPIGIKDITSGHRSNVGYYGFIVVGGDLGPREDPLAEWRFTAGGYTDRGPAGGPALKWDRPWGTGAAEAWAIYDVHQGPDRTGFVPDDEFRWRLIYENRTRLNKDLLFDTEANAFSDRGVNFEFFERDEIEHKDRETYARLHWSPSTVVATLTAKAHVRQFVTETTEEPQAGLWLTSVPLLQPAGRGGPAIDLSSVSQAGYLRHRFDDDLFLDDYGAWRLRTDTTANFAASLGGLRLTSWMGMSGATYFDRDDGQEDLTRTALLAGVRLNMQFHRTWPWMGGPFVLNGFRHVIDADLLFGGRFADSAEPDEVPQFDRYDAEEERSAVIARLRNRFQTHDKVGVRDLLDLETAVKWFTDDVGPYGKRTPGEFDFQFRGKPTPTAYVTGEGDIDFGIPAIEHASVGVGVMPMERLAVGLGVRYSRNDFFSPGVDVTWRFSDKYGVRLYEAYDVNNGENTLQLLFRRYSPDHVILFGVRMDGYDDVSIELSFSPAIGGIPSNDRGFRDQPDLDAWGTFPWR